MPRANAGEQALRNALKDGPVIVCMEGPLDKRWYSERNFLEMQEAERIMLPFEDRSPMVGPYQPTKKIIPSRSIEGLTGTVWRWTGEPEPTPKRSPY